MKEPLPTEFTEEPPQEVAVIDKKALAKATKAAEEKEIARIRQQFNTRTMRIKTKLLAEAGVEIERWGIKMVGHGRFACAGDVADRAIAAIDEDIERLKETAKPEVIAELRMMQLRFNKQIIEVGKSHIDAAREAGGKASSNMQIAFPAGQVVVAVSPAKPSVNVTEKALTNGGSGT